MTYNKVQVCDSTVLLKWNPQLLFAQGFFRTSYFTKVMLKTVSGRVLVFF